MKKLTCLVFAFLLMAMNLQAKVAYLLPNDCSYDAANGNLNGFIAETQNGVDQWPELHAAVWFRDNYVKVANPTGVFISGADFAANHGDITTLWVHIDRVGLSSDDCKAKMGGDAFVAALKSFVEAGGNVLVSKQATRLIGDIGRAGYPEYNNGGYDKSNEQWFIATHFANRSNTGHYIYHRHNDDISADAPGNLESAWVMDVGYNTCTDHNCGYAPSAFGMANNSDYGRLTEYETNNACRVLGTWGGCTDMPYAGMMEFYPKDNYKGTVMMFGLATYMWIANNRGWGADHIRFITQSALEYLDPNLTWTAEPQDGVIGAFTTFSATCDGATVKYYTSDATIVNIDENNGGVYYNYFGTATITAKAFFGDRCMRELTKTITVTGGEPRTFGYVLPYSLHTMSNYDNESSLRPDFEAADWFYQNYVKGNIGFFIKPNELGNYVNNANLQCVWIHNDHVGLESATYYTDLGGDTFKDNLATLLANGKNVFVSKQATRLIGDLGRNDYPSYANGGYAKRDAWSVGNHWELDGTNINHSTHAIYANLHQNPQIMDSGQHTDNNDVWNNFGSCSSSQKCRLEEYQSTHNCLILGGWGHNTLLECAGFVEYYPNETQKGTLVAMGLAAYHWAKPTDNIEILTRDILYYLSITQAPEFVWITEPKDGYTGGSMQLAVDQKDAKLVYESSNPAIATVSETGLLQYVAAGDVTITASYCGDGYLLPKNAKSTFISKQIHITDCSIEWNQSPVDGIVGGVSTVGVSKSPDNLTVKYFSTDNDIATITDDGVVYYNYPGTCTISVDLMDGDNKIKSLNQSITVTAGTIQGPFAYLLVSSLNQIPVELVNEVEQKPDYNAAKWFYDNYVSQNKGCFVTPQQVKEGLVDGIQVLWINIDRCGLTSEQCAALLTPQGGNFDDFKSGLKNFLNSGSNGHNLFLSKQATRLLGDLGRTGYPTYSYEDAYMTDGSDWKSGNKWTLGSTTYNYSTHAVYGNGVVTSTNMGENPVLVQSGVQRTNHNCLFEVPEASRNDKQYFDNQQSTLDCRILGSWGNNSSLECIGFAEFYPHGEIKGTIIMMGLAAYQWGTDAVSDNIKTLTGNILAYLNQTAISLDWGNVPDQMELTEGKQTYQLEGTPCGINWTHTTDGISISKDSKDSTNRTVFITPKSVGDCTIYFSASGDGYNMPKNVPALSQITKHLKVVDTSCGTCFKVTF